MESVTDGVQHIIIMCLSERTDNYHVQLGVKVSTLHCHQETDFRTGMAAMRAVSNVSVTVRGKVPRRCPQTTSFEEKGEQKRGIEPKSSAFHLTTALPVENQESRICICPL